MNINEDFDAVLHDYHDHCTKNVVQLSSKSRGGAAAPFPVQLHDMLDQVSRSRDSQRSFAVDESSIFLCHEGGDKDLVRQVHRRLKERGIETTFFDEHSLVCGDTLSDTIYEALQQCDTAVVFVNKAFFTKKWPPAELKTLLERRQNGNGPRILPIVTDDMTHEELKALAPALSEIKYVRADATNDPFCYETLVDQIVLQGRGGPENDEETIAEGDEEEDEDDTGTSGHPNAHGRGWSWVWQYVETWVPSWQPWSWFCQDMFGQWWNSFTTLELEWVRVLQPVLAMVPSEAPV